MNATPITIPLIHKLESILVLSEDEKDVLRKLSGTIRPFPMPENLERRLSRLIARKRAEAKAARERETKQAQNAAHRDAVAASVAEKWDQDQHIISEVTAYFEAKLSEFGVKLAPDFRPGNGHTIIGIGTIKVLGLDGRDRRVTLTVHNQGAVHVSYETPPSKAALLEHKEFQIATATRATYEAEIFDFLEFAL